MAAHIEEQEELENFKHFWKSWGRWLFALLLVAAISYLGYVLYQQHQESQNQEAAALLEKMVVKAQSGSDVTAITTELQTLKQDYPKSIAAAQAALMVGATHFDQKKYDESAAEYQWVLTNQSAELVKVLAAQRLAVVRLQQAQYDSALKALEIEVSDAFKPLLLETRGDILLAQSKPKEALEAYQNALNSLPENAAERQMLQLKIDQVA